MAENLAQSQKGHTQLAVQQCHNVLLLQKRKLLKNVSTGKDQMPGKAHKKMTPRQKKLAAMTPPRNKITRGDVITAARKNAKRKK